MSKKTLSKICSNNIFKRLAFATMGIFLTIIITMQFTGAMRWSLVDFMALGILVFGIGASFLYFAKVTPKKYRMLLGVFFWWYFF